MLSNSRMKKLCLTTLLAAFVSACGESKKDDDDVPGDVDEAFAESELGKKQAECNGKGVILDSVADFETCDTLPLSTWECTETGLKQRLALEDAENKDAILKELAQHIVDGFVMEQCGEKKEGDVTTIKVILLKKEFDGETFSALPKRLSLEIGGKEAGFVRLNPFLAPINQCVPMAIEHRGGASYQLEEADADIAITLDTSLTVYSTSTCATAVTSLTIAKGKSAVLAWFNEPSEVDNVHFGASAAGFPPMAGVLLDFADETISPKLELSRFVTGTASSSAAGACIPIKIDQKANAGPRNATSADAVSIAVSSTHGKLFSNSGCTKEISATTMAAGSTFQMVWLKAATAGSASVTAAASFDTKTLTVAVE